MLLLGFGGSALLGHAAPPVGPVVNLGTAKVTTQGSVTTIQTSDKAVLSWQNFNIGLGQTTTFVQPSSSSVVWNQIHDSNPSQILGTLNANGLVVLQNSAGFAIGGQAAINAHGLVMTTSPTPVPNLAAGGAWDFGALPPSAGIVNYGKINIGNGGSAYLIAEQVDNQGSISAPGGSIGLVAGHDVLLSSRPDGRGLSAKVTLPAGTVNNAGRLAADGGSITLQAGVVNQGGLAQANSVRNVNGVIELVAADAVNLGANSVISARGDDQGVSAGGTVTIKGGNTFHDQTGSTISVAGGAQGGNGGQVELSAATLPPLQTKVDGHATAGYHGGRLWLDPYDLTLDDAFVNSLSPDLNSGLYSITLAADDNITLDTIWRLSDPGASALLSLTAGNSIIFNDQSAIVAGKNWSVSLSAGPQNLTSAPAPGTAGVYLNGNSYLQTQDGNISVWAANEVIVNPGDPYPNSTGNPGNNGIRTVGGGAINVTAQFGEVNTGGNDNGFIFGQLKSPYYKVSPNLGGISTMAGGDVTINAGGNVRSYLPVTDNYNQAKFDAGTGAFGAAPGNVTITAGGDVSGHYVLANGTGSITAGGNIGAPSESGGFALSLIKGSWKVAAPNGTIYVQDIRNPSGIFNDRGGSSAAFAGYHYFDYDPAAAVTLNAGVGVEITGAGAPHDVPSAPGNSIPLLFPPSLTVNAGAGGLVLDAGTVLFPSPQGELRVTTTHGGDFRSYSDPNNPAALFNYTLSMSDSGAKSWYPGGDAFGLTDHAATPPELNNPNPVVFNLAGGMENVTLRTTKETLLNVGGSMYNASFIGQNLHPLDTTLLTVKGSVSFSPVYAFTHLSQPIVGANPLLPNNWDAIFSLLIDPNASLLVPPTILAGTPAQQTAYALAHLRLALKDGYQLQGAYDPNANPGFIYDAATGQLGFQYQMNQNVLGALSGAVPVLKFDANGNVITQRGTDGQYYFATTTATLAPVGQLTALFNASQSSVANSQNLSAGFQMGGPGQFILNADSLDLGSSGGIFSWGVASAYNPVNYSYLAPWTPAGASIKVNVTGDISLLTSTIASIDGGNVMVTSGGSLYLSQGNFALIPVGANVSYGIFTAGHSDVIIDAGRDVDIGGARIATFNGGNITIVSEHGTVNAGNGANSILVIPTIYHDPVSGDLLTGAINNPSPFGSGVLSVLPTGTYQAAGGNGLPGNITITTPQGNIISTLGGIQQYALNGSVTAGPTITLSAGTAPSAGNPGFAGNVDLGSSGVIGGAININAQGTISGLIVSRQDANIQAAQSFHGTLLAGGSATVTATAGTVTGTIIGIGGVSASGAGGVTASVLGQNVSIGGGQSTSTLGTSAGTTAAGQAAAQQANNDAKQALAADNSATEDEKKRKPVKLPMLTKRLSRVTVILPKS